MSKCTFHDLEADRKDLRLFELVEQAYQTKEPVLIFTSSGERAAEIDRFLWIMKQESFIPHAVVRSADENPELAVTIVLEEINPIKAKVLIADGHCSLDFSCAFPVIHEFVDHSTPPILEACRERFRSYRTRKVSVEHRKEA